MVHDIKALILFPILLVGPLFYAVFILRKLDQAARQRKKMVAETKFRFMIVDILSLILMIQIPFKLLRFDLPNVTLLFLITVALVHLTMVWLATIRTVSEAGITTFKWRALISMILIPTMYVGCLYLSITSINWLIGNPVSNEMIFWLGFSLVGMALSPWIVRGALNSVSEDQQSEPKDIDPFAD